MKRHCFFFVQKTIRKTVTSFNKSPQRSVFCLRRHQHHERSHRYTIRHHRCTTVLDVRRGLVDVGRRRRDQSCAHAVNEHDRRGQHFSDGRAHRPTAARPTFAEPCGTVTANQKRQPRSTHRCCLGRTMVNRIPNPRLAGPGRGRVRLPQVRYAHGARSKDRARVGSLGVA